MNVRILRAPDDPDNQVSARISAGTARGLGHYIVFRGTKNDVVECLQACLDALKAIPDTVTIPVDDDPRAAAITSSAT